MQYGGPDLRDPANYRRALEDYYRRRQAAERGGYVEDFNMHPDDLLRMQGGAPTDLEPMRMPVIPEDYNTGIPAPEASEALLSEFLLELMRNRE